MDYPKGRRREKSVEGMAIRIDFTFLREGQTVFAI